ncbi:MAG: response regulator transcription factor, partial [Bacteroidota bacterium]
EGFEVFTADNGRLAIDILKKQPVDLVLLDVMMPEMDGIETCEEIRKLPVADDVIIAFLTARSEDYSQIAGFDAGADDYITKPVKPKLLVSRIRALLKRGNRKTGISQAAGSILHKGDLSIDLERYVVINNGLEITLPKKEFELLLLLASKPDKVFTRDEIYRKVWGDTIIVGDRTIDVHIRKLRRKIGDYHIATLKGIGYKFKL